ncbi:hypothetical protein [Litorihabitans aurantiacus]|uniref:Uncharacterized protein n=1 Tax=Litorihabitans aurantiacus TaxID=1930061 RepID=A0AA37UQX4_9MICO|nr:hypothetical protein [Litorihabitans aurantiacus]GMA30923.1 hypothetical protein GCM10025875_09150 [Litorihabitans aurantiacus]
MSVLLTFQPGRQSMVEQVALYDEVLRRPGVGVALEPAWRLQPGEVPGSGSGVVAADEVNAVVDHLAALTDEAALPPKMLLVRMANPGSVTDVGGIEADRVQVGVVLEVNGAGVTAPADPADPAAPAAVTPADVWGAGTALPWGPSQGRGWWGWGQGRNAVGITELQALVPAPVVVTSP